MVHPGRTDLGRGLHGPGYVENVPEGRMRAFPLKGWHQGQESSCLLDIVILLLGDAALTPNWVLEKEVPLHVGVDCFVDGGVDCFECCDASYT